MSHEPPEMSFETFVLSLGTATLVALGEVNNPVTQKQEKNITAAKQHIDILEMLSKKTANNLTEQEGRLLQQILYEVRIKYVAQTSQNGSQPNDFQPTENKK